MEEKRCSRYNELLKSLYSETAASVGAVVVVQVLYIFYKYLTQILYLRCKMTVAAKILA